MADTKPLAPAAGVPLSKGFVPKVQGGFVPTGNVSSPPPTGGSGVKPPAKK